MERARFDKYIEQHVARYYRALFFRKALDWSSEWEYRYLLNGLDNANEFVSIKSAFCAVCLGADFPPAYEPIVTSTCKSLNIQGAHIQWRNGFPIMFPIF